MDSKENNIFKIHQNPYFQKCLLPLTKHIKHYHFRQPDYAISKASKGVDEKMFDAMNRVELQPLDQEFQCCAEGGLVEKVNLSRNGSSHVQRIFC